MFVQRLVIIGLVAAHCQQLVSAEQRIPWTESRVVGSPEPPLPYVLQRVYPGVGFDKPVSIHPIPGEPRMVVCEQPGRIKSFLTEGDSDRVDLMADFSVQPPPLSEVARGDGKSITVFNLAYHPRFEVNRTVVVCYIVGGTPNAKTDGTHIATFEVSRTEPPVLLLETERTILRFGAGGHNGCTVAFDNDGLLHISTGDGASPTPPDPHDHGQNVGDLHSAILRIDIDRMSRDGDGNERPYAIPADNPFVDHPGARPEVYAYGFRNPWRMSFDRQTGDLWVGDVGWEAWEMVYRVRRGGNYGWPIKEGPGDARPDAVRGPTPILPADVALSHSEAASVTGGVVYRGDRLPEIKGQYVFGDWVTRKYWAVAFDEQQVLSFREIAFGPVKPVSFELDHDGELLILDYNSTGVSGIYRLIPNPAPPSDLPFPKRLSETGLFSSTLPLRPADGVIAYEIQAPMWRDGATTQYHLAIPELGKAKFLEKSQRITDIFRTKVVLPPGSVLVKTYWMETTVGDPSTRRPIETQISHNIALGDWNFYTFRWSGDASDAELVSAGGDIQPLRIEDSSAPDGHWDLNWSFASRTQCRTCHTPWRGETLSFVDVQLRNDRKSLDSLHQLSDGGWLDVDPALPAQVDGQTVTLVNPNDESRSIDQRARSYLHANCSHCHLFGGSSSAAFDVSIEKLLDATGLVDTMPMRGDCQLDEARLIAPGALERSVLLYRMAKLGSGRMPAIGINRVDHEGVDLISRWIAGLGVEHASGPSLNSMAVDPQSLASTSGALRLASAIAGGRLDQKARQSVIDEALQAPPQISELFEAWAVGSQRIDRLGPGFNPQSVLDIQGDPESGRQAFLAGRGQCIQCHQIHGQGIGIGPELSKIGLKYPNVAELLRHIIQPSLEIAEAYRAITILTDSGQAHTGRVLERTETTIQLQDASGRLSSIRLDEIELEKPSDQSLMPEQLLDPLTPQQAADLIAYLRDLK